jgi:hypothetical protein
MFLPFCTVPGNAEIIGVFPENAVDSAADVFYNA